MPVSGWGCRHLNRQLTFRDPLFKSRAQRMKPCSHAYCKLFLELTEYTRETMKHTHCKGCISYQDFCQFIFCKGKGPYSLTKVNSMKTATWTRLLSPYSILFHLGSSHSFCYFAPFDEPTMVTHT